MHWNQVTQSKWKKMPKNFEFFDAAKKAQSNEAGKLGFFSLEV